MAERARVMDGTKAYGIALDNLSSTWSFSRVLQAEYPGRYFHYGEEGWGLILPHGLVHISTESAEDIRAVKGRIRINPRTLELINPRFRDIDRRIPGRAVAGVLAFTDEVKAKMKALKDRIPQRAV